jgi:hypothetical protein
MEVHVRIPTPLKKLAGERDVIKAQGGNSWGSTPMADRDLSGPPREASR